MERKLVIVQVAALSRELELPGVNFARAASVFPAVTCTVQASFRTASRPSSHGMIANGVFARELARPMFWEQSAGLVAGERIWDGFRARGGSVGILFWQQALGERADVVLSPQPIHKHHGGMIESCYSRPEGLYEQLCRAVGGPFRLRHYWGPLASAKAGDWIARATAALLERDDAPDLLLTYLPTLDYDLQRHGPAGRQADTAHDATAGQLRTIMAAAGARGHDVLIFGDYAMAPVSWAVHPNRALADAGLLRTREVAGMSYPDLWDSPAFAVVDHEIAHVYVRDASRLGEARDVLSRLDGVAEVLDRDAQAAAGIVHANSGELILTADEGAWLAYPWWTDRRKAPDYASHVDIHNKPGYDPCELLLGLWPPMSIRQDPAGIRGSHGRVGPGRDVVWASSAALPGSPRDILELAQSVRTWLGD